MKLAAHPLIVAAALGLLGPSALEQELDDEALEHSSKQVRPAHETSPSPDQVAQVAEEWRVARLSVDAPSSWP